MPSILSFLCPIVFKSTISHHVILLTDLVADRNLRPYIVLIGAANRTSLLVPIGGQQNEMYFNRDGKEFRWDKDFQFFYDPDSNVSVIQDGCLIPTRKLQPNRPQDHDARDTEQSQSNSDATQGIVEDGQLNQPSSSAFSFSDTQTQKDVSNILRGYDQEASERIFS